ncbi:GNAT family N-acetyltransferase [Nodosilinea nodulosa]|uniref:GNAT family N-acetyltransferase n=1 Tax=Nodosilinea nodulosa TaxID=416001 RepID=UPI000380F455|nr:GNAT family protein [Nodosilinea nodulosa]
MAYNDFIVQRNSFAMELSVRDGFYLTSVYPSDKDAYLEHLNDRSISDAIPFLPYPYTESEADWWIQHRLKILSEQGKEISFVLRNPEGYLIGSVGIDTLRIGEAHRAEVGYWLASNYRGQGLISSALNVFIQHAFDSLEVSRLTAHTLDFNAASARILEKNKFSLEGCLRQHTRTRNGIFDTLIWGLLKSDW